MKEYLSFGGGVNSTALLILMNDLGLEFETVFVNHGGDHPDTYEYVEYLRDQGYSITDVKPSVVWKGKWDNIYDYFYFHKSIPFIKFRICTAKFKIQPFNNYIKKPAEVHIGYDYGEGRRVKRQLNRNVKNIDYRYLLYNERITRNGCIELIKRKGLKVPPKSGCYFCPFQKKKEWKKLMVEDPDLFQKALDLEENSKTKGLLQGKYRLSSIHQTTSLDDWVGEDMDLSCGVWKCRE